MVPPNDVGGVRGTRHRLRGDVKPKAGAPSPAAAVWPVPPKTTEAAPVGAKKRVLFVCIGNSCRSQMAEAFARAYGADTLWVQSAGLGPAPMVAPLTRQILEEKNVRSDNQFPKGLDMMVREAFDLVVNMSGHKFKFPSGEMVEWVVRDPIGQTAETYRSVADQIEALVMRLILETRTASQPRP